MDEDIKEYAGTLYEDSAVESARILHEDLKAISAITFIIPGPLSGLTLGKILDSYGRHIERCMEARIDSYERAYAESGRVPSEQDLAAIKTSFQDVRSRTVASSVSAARQLLGSRGVSGVPSGASQTELEDRTTNGHDHVFRKWKLWKAKLQFKPKAAPVTEREKQMDPLLPVYSRAEFNTDISSVPVSASEGSPVSLLFADLDKFKAINDGPGGHAAGDRALKAFVEVLLGVSGGKGAAYRYGGDEFCVLLPNHSLNEALAVAERIRQQVQAIKDDEVLSDGLSASIGAACFPESTSKGGSELVELGDRAMYVSKRAGGNRVTKADDLR